MPMFPDSGVPAGEAKNSIDVVTVTPCDELWYSTSRCQPRFDPAAANALLAEVFNTIMKGEVTYDCLNLNNLERAVRYIDQRGLPRGCYMLGGPQTYTGILDPPCTRYNDYMTLTVIPAMNNMNVVTLNLGHGPAYILRNDGKHLERDDLVAGKPQIIAFYAGYWYFCGLAASQVPILVKGGIDCWIRTDGNDVTGDGTANTPEKAFRTINGCWAAVGSRYASTPLFSINMRLGIPGTYENGYIGTFGGNVSLTGDPTNRSQYKIKTGDLSGIGTEWCALACVSLGGMTINGVTFLHDHPPPGNCWALRIGGCNTVAVNCQWELTASNTAGGFIHLNEGTFGTVDSTLIFNGNGGTTGFLIAANEGSNFFGARHHLQDSLYQFNNIACTGPCLNATGLSLLIWNSANIGVVGVTGPQYAVNTNSVIAMGGRQPPGTTAGSVSSGGQFIP